MNHFSAGAAGLFIFSADLYTETPAYLHDSAPL
jgi:hypothetical protein